MTRIHTMPNPLAEELQKDRRACPCTLVILGATGDLTERKLVPALAGLHADGLLPGNFAVVGFARRDKTDDEFHADLGRGVEEHGREACVTSFRAMRESIFYHRSTFEDQDGYRRLAHRLDEIDAKLGTRGNRIFYLAAPPGEYSEIIQHLAATGLSAEDRGTFRRVIIEKPFGHDLASARALNDQVSAAFDEHQVFRIDHYLGKETVQNILAMRFANGIFEPLWNENYIDHVQITVAESIGIEGRGAYFDAAGIIRDMIQNHLLQVMSLVAMEPPVSLDADSVRDEKVKVLRAIGSFPPDQVPSHTVRGQYTGDFVDAVEVPGYLEEEGVDAGSKTETYAAVRLEVTNWRWGRTPFFLRAGKRMPRRASEVAIHFKRPPHHLFPGNDSGPNILLLRIQPDEGISLRFGSKVPGPDLQLRDVRMDFRYGSAFGRHSADAYERLLLDAMIGDSTLFARRDEVEEAWRIVDSIVAGWKDQPPHPYGAGTWGPDHAGDLLGTGRVWRRP